MEEMGKRYVWFLHYTDCGLSNSLLSPCQAVKQPQPQPQPQEEEDDAKQDHMSSGSETVGFEEEEEAQKEEAEFQEEQDDVSMLTQEHEEDEYVSEDDKENNGQEEASAGAGTVEAEVIKDKDMEEESSAGPETGSEAVVVQMEPSYFSSLSLQDQVAHIKDIYERGFMGTKDYLECMQEAKKRGHEDEE